MLFIKLVLPVHNQCEEQSIREIETSKLFTQSSDSRRTVCNASDDTSQRKNASKLYFYRNLYWCIANSKNLINVNSLLVFVDIGNVAGNVK